MKTLARQSDKAAIARRLEAVTPGAARGWGRMSAHQMVCHLSDSLRILSGQKTVSDATGPLQRTIGKWIALYLPVRWPAGIPTRPEIDQYVGGTKPAAFAADVADLQTLLELVTTQPEMLEGKAHPIFGRMSKGDWLRWGYVHMDHHLRQFGL